MATQKKKVAVLGGGVGAITAAFELTSPDNGNLDRYDVTVYQMGWRLGGKGASGRNADCGQRIEEHGLHIWLGLYHNAFRAMDACYTELNRPPGAPLAGLMDAFKPQSFITFMDPDPVTGSWGRWDITFEEYPDQRPGGTSTLTPFDYVEKILWLIVSQLGGGHAVSPLGVVVSIGKGVEEAVSDWAKGLLHLTHGSDHADGKKEIELVEALRLVRGLGKDVKKHSPEDHIRVLDLVERFVDRLQKGMEGDPIHDHPTARRMGQLFDISLAAVKGLFREGVITGEKTFSDLDDKELKEFLKEHGAHESSLTSSALRGYYDIAFAFKGGKPSEATQNSGAGTALNAILRMCFDYRGAFMYEMQAGMGDTIFAPYYEVLKRRGVKFEFFNKVRNLELSEDGERIQRIHIDRQVDVIGDEYEPLVDVNGLPCWPSEPHYSQIVEGETLKKGPPGDLGPYNLESSWSGWEPVGEVIGADGNPGLVHGEDFDDVVLGIALGALPSICGELIGRDSAWKDMVDNVETVQTQATQLWLSKSIWDMGWKREEGDARTVLDGYKDPLNSWADMSHLIRHEDWPADNTPQTLIYLCGTQSAEPPPRDAGPEYPVQQYDRVRRTAIDWLSKFTGPIWPGATKAGTQGFDWDLVVATGKCQKETPANSQYYRGNIDPTEAYVQTIAGSTKYRLRAGESGFENLVLAGDWTKTGFDVGCVEAATMSGMQASRAISGSPRVIVGEDPGQPMGETVGAPVYIDRPDDEEMSPPYQFKDLTIRSFPLEADGDQLQRFVDRYLNVAPPDVLEYKPLGKLVYMQVSSYGKLSSIRDPKGYFAEKEVSFNILVARGKRENGKWRAQDIAFYFPYVYVDNPWAVATGREVFGYPKSLSHLHIPDDPKHPEGTTVSAPILSSLSASTKLEDLPLIKVVGKGGGLIHDILKTIDGAIHGVKDTFFGSDGLFSELSPELAKLVIETFTDKRIGIVSLKQFRDAETPTRACYQGIVNTVMKIERYHGVGLLSPDFEVHLHYYGGLRLAEELGLKVARNEETDKGKIQILKPKLPYWISFDCQLTRGENLFTAS